MGPDCMPPPPTNLPLFCQLVISRSVPAISLVLALLVGVFSLVVVSTESASAETEQVAYSFVDGDTGGVAVLEVDVKTGKIVGQKKLFASTSAGKAGKLRIYDRDQGLVLLNPSKNGPHLFLARMDGRSPVKPITLSAKPDELRVGGEMAIATCEKDRIVVIDLKRGVQKEEWDADKLLDPPGNEAEDVLVSVKHQVAVLSFQKDGAKGNKLGSRVVILRLSDHKVVADLRLPRDRPGLHIPGDNTAQGPCPEVLFVSEPVDRLIATLDLYGAVAIMDWKSATMGELKHLTYLSTAPDETWGTAFPDRAMLVYLGGNPYSLVCNSGKIGGSAIVSLRNREIVWRAHTPPGLEKPIYVGPVRKAFSVCSGKTKQRKGNKITKTMNPKPGVYVFDLSSAAAVKRKKVEVIPSDQPLLKITLTTSKKWLVLAGGAEKADTLYVFDPRKKQFVDSQPSVGALQQFASP